MAYWEWLEDENIERELGETIEAPSGGSYGARIIQDNTPPRVVYNLSAEAMTSGDYAAARSAAMTRGATYTASLAGGGTVTGIVRSFSAQRIKGLDRYNVRISLQATS